MRANRGPGPVPSGDGCELPLPCAWATYHYLARSLLGQGRQSSFQAILSWCARCVYCVCPCNWKPAASGRQSESQTDPRHRRVICHRMSPPGRATPCVTLESALGRSSRGDPVRLSCDLAAIPAWPRREKSSLRGILPRKPTVDPCPRQPETEHTASARRLPPPAVAATAIDCRPPQSLMQPSRHHPTRGKLLHLPSRAPCVRGCHSQKARFPGLSAFADSSQFSGSGLITSFQIPGSSTHQQRHLKNFAFRPVDSTSSLKSR
jgi:hypothetical protein